MSSLNHNRRRTKIFEIKDKFQVPHGPEYSACGNLQRECNRSCIIRPFLCRVIICCLDPVLEFVRIIIGILSVMVVDNRSAIPIVEACFSAYCFLSDNVSISNLRMSGIDISVIIERYRGFVKGDLRRKALKKKQTVL